MPLDAQTFGQDSIPDCPAGRRLRWGASSEVGLLTDVLLSAPPFLQILPCNEAARESLAKGLCTSTARAARQHRAFAEALEQANVRCHFVAPRESMPDLCFTRDPGLMSPWGVIQLRPSARHRRGEPDQIASAVRKLGVPIYDRIEEGAIEGGDVCLLREGLVAIGISNDRTDEAGAKAVGAIFERSGWQVLQVRFNPRYLHLDTILTIVDDDLAVVLPAALGEDCLDQLRRLGISLIYTTVDEVAGLNANLLSLGDRRIVAPRGTSRLSTALAKRGLDVIEVDLDQFTQCGGGPHCLTMPLARQPA